MSTRLGLRRAQVCPQSPSEGRVHLCWGFSRLEARVVLCVLAGVSLQRAGQKSAR